MDITQVDPKGLIREGYRIEGITTGECRTIFLDWAIQVPGGADVREFIQFCLDTYAADLPAHPMTQVLLDGLKPSPKARRRGGRGARVAQA